MASYSAGLARGQADRSAVPIRICSVALAELGSTSPMVPTPPAPTDRLQRFRTAQDGPPPNFATALAELASGGKRSHWIWYILPQLEGLGASPTARHHALRGCEEATQYLRDDVLRARLVAIARAIAAGLDRGSSLERLLGSRLDAQKAVSSLTLFERLARDTERGDDPVTVRSDCASLAAAAERVLASAETQGLPRCAFTVRELERASAASPARARP